MNIKNYRSNTMVSALLGVCLLHSACNSSDTKKNDKKENVTQISYTTQEPKEEKTMKLETLESGLKYQILKEGDNAAGIAQKGNRVTVHYTGWLDNNGAQGQKFDSSVDRGTPFTFNLGAGQVIAGWDQGVDGMKIGEKRRLIIPAALGYGSRGAGGVIPGNATLIFDVELLKVN